MTYNSLNGQAYEEIVKENARNISLDALFISMTSIIIITIGIIMIVEWISFSELVKKFIEEY